MITRFAVLPDSRRVMLGIDKANLFEAGFVYEAFGFDGEVIFRKVGKYALDRKSHPNENSDVNAQVTSGLHLVTPEELDNLYPDKP